MSANIVIINEKDKHDLVWKIDIDKNKDYQTTFTKYEGQTQIHCADPFVFCYDSEFYIFNRDMETMDKNFVEVITLDNSTINTKKTFNPFTSVDNLSNYSTNIRFSRTNDSVILIGADAIENNVKTADIYEMKFGEEEFVPKREKLSASLIAYTALTSYQGYTYALCGTIPDEETSFIAKFETSYYYPEYEKYQLGDADGDLDVNIIDATIIQQYLANLIDIPTIKLGAADADKDSKVSILDANKIQRILANLDD